MLRTVGLDNILTFVLCLRQEWYVVYQLVRKVHPFRLWEFGRWLFFGFLVSSCFVHAGGFGVGFFTSWCVQGLGLVGVPFFGSGPLGVDQLGHYLPTGKKAWQFIIQPKLLGMGCVLVGIIS